MMLSSFGIKDPEAAKSAIQNIQKSEGIDCKKEYGEFVKLFLENCFDLKVNINEDKTLKVTVSQDSKDGLNQGWRSKGSRGNQILSILSKHSELLGFDDIAKQITDVLECKTPGTSAKPLGFEEAKFPNLGGPSLPG